MIFSLRALSKPSIELISIHSLIENTFFLLEGNNWVSNFYTTGFVFTKVLSVQWAVVEGGRATPPQKHVDAVGSQCGFHRVLMRWWWEIWELLLLCMSPLPFFHGAGHSHFYYAGVFFILEALRVTSLQCCHLPWPYSRILIPPQTCFHGVLDEIPLVAADSQSVLDISELVDLSFLPALHLTLIERSSCRPETEKTNINQLPLEGSLGLIRRMRKL